MQDPAIASDRKSPGTSIIGASVAMQRILETVDQVAPTDITVLITGESGVGKEVIAKAIHAGSKRSGKPLVTVNCGAIPEGIIESELFGHERGSFTGATDQRKGYFELADGGTIFLDEIGELPLSAQVKFLRILENGEFLRVGSSSPRHVDVRILAATNKDLESEVRHGQFRQDLYFRLRSVNIHVPPLRQRPEDIPALLNRFIEEVTGRDGVPFGGLSQDAMDLLRTYHWPGNVRELRNVVESMLVLERGRALEAADVKKYLKNYRAADEERPLPIPFGKSIEQAERELILRALLDIKGNILELKGLFANHLKMLEENGPGSRETMQVGNGGENRSLSLQEMEQRMIVEALERFKGNRRVAARSLNISERTLYRKIKEYGLG
jgi:transcriptional regulator with PAS, ATPase and Fis domain